MARAAFALGSFGLLLLPSNLPATCGGGGGGGKGGLGAGAQPQIYTPTWASSLEAALSRAAEGKKGCILYFVPEHATKDHPAFSTKMMADWSAEHPLVKIPYKDKDPLRAEYGAERSKHRICVCDWFGNAFKRYSVTDAERLPFPEIDETLRFIEKLVEQAQKKAEEALKKAQKLVEKGNLPAAAKPLGEIFSFKGYPQVEKARPLLEKVEQAANEEIEGALKLEDKKARARELQKIKTKWKGLPAVEKKCDEEIGKATGMAPEPDDEDLGLSDRVWSEVLGSIDGSARAPLLAERANEAMYAGLDHEIHGRYDRALEAYALAAGLDPLDPIPLVYLGELYRHHLGRWDEAKAVFRRVIALNRNDLAVAVALHGIGKMMIWEGNSEEGLRYFARSIERRPTALCYRNLAVYWNTEKEFRRAFDYATKAFELDPNDGYNRVFYAVYLLMDGRKQEAEQLIQATPFDLSFSYNLACYYAVQGKREIALKHLHDHFYRYEQYEDVRRREMAEARMDINFKSLYDDPDFIQLTALAGR